MARLLQSFSIVIAALVLLPGPAPADFDGYRPTTLEAVIAAWNAKTKAEGPGFSFSQPEKISFVATLLEKPGPCSTGSLQTVLRMMGFSDWLKQAKVTNCIGLATSSGQRVSAYVQDVLVPGLDKDAAIGRPVEIYSEFLAYEVKADRSHDAPLLLVSRFEPK